jgi:hypothetical protein
MARQNSVCSLINNLHICCSSKPRRAVKRCRSPRLDRNDEVDFCIRPVNPFQPFPYESGSLCSVTAECDVDCGMLVRGARCHHRISARERHVSLIQQRTVENGGENLPTAVDEQSTLNAPRAAARKRHFLGRRQLRQPHKDQFLGQVSQGRIPGRRKREQHKIRYVKLPHQGQPKCERHSRMKR